MQTRIDAVNRVLREQITGIRVVRAFVREPYETERFARRQRRPDRHRAAVGRLHGADLPDRDAGAQRRPASRCSGSAPHRVDAGADADRRADRVPQLPDADPDVGDDGHVHADDGPARRGLRRADRRGARHRVLGACRRPTPVTELPEPRSAGAATTSSSPIPGAERRCCATSRFTRRPGQTTAIIGSTGAGKTTLISLIPRLFDATGGAVLVDGVDVRELDPDVLWSRIGLVPQQPFLFSGTVASNLRYGNPDATDEELWHALEIAQAADFVRGDARAAGGPDRPGRHQRLRRAAAAAGHRPGAGPAARRSTCSTTRSPRSTSPPTPGCGPRCARTPRTPR